MCAICSTIVILGATNHTELSCKVCARRQCKRSATPVNICYIYAGDSWRTYVSPPHGVREEGTIGQG